MLMSNRRAFLRNMGSAVLVAGVDSALRGTARRLLHAEEAQPQIPLPLPANEAALAQIEAEPWLRIDAGNVFLKGMAFDRHNNLFVVAAYPSSGGADNGLAARLDRPSFASRRRKK